MSGIEIIVFSLVIGYFSLAFLLYKMQNISELHTMQILKLQEELDNLVDSLK